MYSRKIHCSVSALLLLLFCTACNEPEDNYDRLIPLARSLQSDAGHAKTQRLPVVVFVSQKDCEYCELLRQQVLYPMVRADELSAIVILREVSMDSGFTMRDFDGVEITGRQFVTRYGIDVTPTLLFLDDRGERLAESLVGTSNIDFYSFYLNRSIDSATKKFRSTAQ